jgi:chemotaxis protein histidine kinase CheA
MNKLTTKENIERAAEQLTEAMGTTNIVDLKYLANRVLEDMQDKLSQNAWEWIQKCNEMTLQMRTTRADTLKEVLEWVKDNARDEENDLDSMDLEFNLAHQEIIDYLNKLLNQKP